MAWQRRYETDYVFNFWTALGWTFLTCGIYSFYVLYQLMRRSRDHNARRLELLDGATAFAWERCQQQALDAELRPAFERIGQQMAVLRQLTTEFRDPNMWLIIDVLAAFFTGGIGGYVVSVIAYIVLDGDLVRHDYAEGAVEAELSAIYARLGVTIAPPDPSRLKNRHNYAARVVVAIITGGLYLLWWLHDLMVEGNQHFEHNWRWEDELARGVQQLLPLTAA
jgi:hypothetical protein